MNFGVRLINVDKEKVRRMTLVVKTKYQFFLRIQHQLF